MDIDLEGCLLDGCLPIFFVLILGLVAGGAVVLAVDGTFALLARKTSFACKAQNLEPVRQTFSTTVACRARNLGSDTLTIQNR